MKVKACTDTSTIIYRVASSHCFIMRHFSDMINDYSSVMLCQVIMHQNPMFQTCQLKFKYVTSLYPRNWKPHAKQAKHIFDIGMFKPF